MYYIFLRSLRNNLKLFLFFYVGLSFLNIGSGTGYLSTIVGVMLGPYGINHGVDIHKDVIEYAMHRVNEFMQYSKGFNGINFSEPQFVLGNVLCLNNNRKYDRIYCGARVPSDVFLQKIKSLLKEKGVLVYPFQEYVRSLFVVLYI